MVVRCSWRFDRCILSAEGLCNINIFEPPLWALEWGPVRAVLSAQECIRYARPYDEGAEWQIPVVGRQFT